MLWFLLVGGEGNEVGAVGIVLVEVDVEDSIGLGNLLTPQDTPNPAQIINSDEKAASNNITQNYSKLLRF
jgi:hypothetical protein